MVDFDNSLIGGGKQMPAMAEGDFLGCFNRELVKDFDVVDHDVEKPEPIDKSNRHVKSCVNVSENSGMYSSIGVCCRFLM